MLANNSLRVPSLIAVARDRAALHVVEFFAVTVRPTRITQSALRYRSTRLAGKGLLVTSAASIPTCPNAANSFFPQKNRVEAESPSSPGNQARSFPNATHRSRRRSGTEATSRSAVYPELAGAQAHADGQDEVEPRIGTTAPGVKVWENTIAARKLLKDLFRGEMDARWEVSKRLVNPCIKG